MALPCDEGIEITEMLLQYGADPNIRDSYMGDIENGRTPLHIAAAREDNDEVCMNLKDY